MKLPGLHIVVAEMDDFQEEEPTKPEISESMAETLARLRSADPSERPSVRKKPTDPPGDQDHDAPDAR